MDNEMALNVKKAKKLSCKGGGVVKIEREESGL